ncbi:tyrosine-type recombinase/integrase [Leifsonia sp. 22587]|uniref:tyrosine-type recombinase/integrase n=1 Tax=Leifsonia sp. 22587 TaxID=3453946 RepID=UPI003F83BA08
MPTADYYLYRRCGCEIDGRQYSVLRENATPEQTAAACPRMSDPKHGKWGYYIAAGRDPKTNRRRQIRKATFTTRNDAAKAARAIRGKVDGGTLVTPSQQTYAEYLDAWLTQRLTTGEGLRPTTATIYRTYIANDIQPSALGRMKLTDIRRHHVNAFVSNLTADGRGATTVRRIAAVVQGSLKHAWQDELLDHNPGAGIRLPSTTAHEFTPWEPEQVGAFLDVAAAHRLGALFELAVQTGMRRGEIIGLRWSDVNMDKSTITIRNNRTTAGTTIVENAPKTSAGRRTITYDPMTGGVLLTWGAQQRAEADTLGSAWEDTGYVFTYVDGQPLKPQYVTRLFDKLRVQAGLPRMTFHGLRHERASLLLASGAELGLVSKMLGHSSVSVTADIYAHLIAHAAREASEKANESIPRAASAHRVHTGQQ